MGSILFSVTTFFLSLANLASCERINHEFIYPNHTSSYFQFIDANGVFLRSRNGTFNAAFFNPGRQQSKYYLCILHSTSQTVIWSASRDSPFSKSIRLFLSPQGIAVTDKISSGAVTVKWSTQPLNSSVAAMQLTETGNLALLDQFNRSIWQSFDQPTDTIVIGQQLPVGKSLVSSLSDSDYSSGDFQFSVDTYDGLLEWKGSNYWKISMEQNAFVNSNAPISFMALNGTGLYFYGENGSVVVLQVILSPSEFRIAKLGFGGQFTISSLSFRSTTYEFMAPKDICRIPYICGLIGLCTTVTSSGQYSCSCPSGFQNINQGCFPSDASLSLPSACNDTDSVQSSTVSYTSLVFCNPNFSFLLDFFTVVFLIIEHSSEVRPYKGATGGLCTAVFILEVDSQEPICIIK
ncbi:G-type lectin S-receptor-like serine/threonine-protein kinase At5g35370 [Macadamia integrifolia]|uniref:G-type lectin S-receptor-like serine/threonine-protein kinase At5g35370 n=1 Tax=Macadamia integrifolia TaxID=60698 RepID=UPI001C4F7B21|nr:G-type lectin S-receptor-like serine/threonine-protein kinase At5g35370 [Macadamia integrifolia]